jgi:hypothetical protein
MNAFPIRLFWIQWAKTFAQTDRGFLPEDGNTKGYT